MRWFLIAACGVLTLLVPTIVAASFEMPRKVARVTFSAPGDFQKLPWTEAFDALHKKLSTEYAFTQWRRIDWPALYARSRPRIVEAQSRSDKEAYYLAVREHVFSIPDGHVNLGGPDLGLREKMVGGGFGMAVFPLDNGRVIAHVVLPDSPAERAGIRAGAEITSVNGEPVREAVKRISTLWSSSPPGTSANRLLEQYRFLFRAPDGTAIEVNYLNPDAKKPQSARLTAVADNFETLRRTTWRKRRTGDKLVEHRVLPSGYGYVNIFLEDGPALQQLREAITDLQSTNVPGLVLDLRSNAGGDDQMAADMAAIFHSQRSFYEYAQYYNADTGSFDIVTPYTVYVTPKELHFDGPVVALIGPGTGSSGEGVAWQIGRAPRGCTLGLAGTVGAFGMSGGQVKMPEGLTVFYPNGASLNEKGVVQIDSDQMGRGGVLPQIRVPWTRENLLALGEGRDIELETAERTLDKMTGRPQWAQLPEETPAIPIGLDAYRQWDKWYLQRIGVRAYMRSTYDRRGGNEAADASHFLYQLADDHNVALDVAGPGVLYFVRTNHWHGSPWRYTLDGREHIVQETSTANPDKPVENSTFLPERLFPKPLAWTWSTTKGADLNWVPMHFEQSLRLGYSRTHYGTGYYIYHQFVPRTKLSQPLKAWDGQTAPAQDVLDLLSRAGTDIAPKPGTPEGDRLGVKEVQGAWKTVQGEGKTHKITLGRPGVLRAIQFSVPRDQALAFGRYRVRIHWDDRQQASVDAPVSLFFGAGTLYNRDNREWLVKAFPVNIRYDAERVTLACYFPMPFARSARVTILPDGQPPVRDVRWSFRHQPLTEPLTYAAYFHATYRDHPQPERGKDLVLLDTRGVEGSEVWSGHFVGTSWIFSHNANLSTLEGDPRFFFDDSQTPQAYGTGTEEWGGGGDYWGGLNMTLSLAGHPTGARNARDAKNDEDKIESAYRFLLADLMPFGRNARIQLEHGGTNESTEHYETVAYWYGVPSPTLVKTDEFHVGDERDDAAHRYRSPDSSAVYEITSRYELGVDTLNGREIYPAQTDDGCKTTGESTFTLKIDPRNLGVMLRRKLDYALPNQRAEVFVSDAGGEPEWQPAGVWYTAGSNTCVYSNPPQELGATQHVVQTSNRRFRDDEFLLPLALTKGRSAIRIRIKFTPVAIPLFPGHPVPELAWSEIRYWAYSYVAPQPLGSYSR